MVFDLQKASMWKRISAFLFDGILFSVVAVLIALCLSSLLGYDSYRETLNERYNHYAQEYQVDMKPTDEAYEAMDEEQQRQLQAAYEALNQDTAAVQAYRMAMHLTLLIITFSLLITYLLMEFLIPLLLKNGQTLGKKIFGLGLMRTDGVKVSNVALFVRTILGKYTLETMIPVLLLLMVYFGMMGVTALILIGLILVINLAVMIFTQTNSLLHDLMACTVVIDLPSQMIFDSPEEMIAYKEKLAAEKAANEVY